MGIVRPLYTARGHLTPPTLVGYHATPLHHTICTCHPTLLRCFMTLTIKIRISVILFFRRIIWKVQNDQNQPDMKGKVEGALRILRQIKAELGKRGVVNAEIR
jgi:hypothetical protein